MGHTLMHRQLLRLALLLALWCGAVLAAAAWAQSPQPVPALTARVIDQTGTLTAAQKQQLETTLAAIETKHGSQIVVLMVPTVRPEDIASYAHRVASTWKIGRADVGDGLLFVVAKNDRDVRLEVARALEGTVPDIAAARIIDHQVIPHFRNNDFAAGISAGIDALAARLDGDTTLPAPAAQSSSKKRGNPISWEGILIGYIGFVFGGQFLRGMFGRNLGSAIFGLAVGAVAYWWMGILLLAIIVAFVSAFFTFAAGSTRGISSGSRRGDWWDNNSGGGWGGGGGGWGGGSGGGGGGGFSSGGGGSFGGGGASGRW